MDSSQKKYDVEIAGVPLRLRSSHDEKTVSELVEFVNRKLDQALTVTKSGSIQNAAILAALHIAEEHMLMKRQALSELEGFEQRAEKILADFEALRATQAGNS